MTTRPAAGFFRRRFLEPILAQLKRGTSVDALAWAIAGGATASLFPLLGTTTGICVLLGWAFRLNHVALQLANYAFGPLQLLAIPLWIRIGEKVFALPAVDFNPKTAGAELYSAPGPFLSHYGTSALAAIGVWAVAAPLIALALHTLLKPLLNRLKARESLAKPENGATP